MTNYSVWEAYSGTAAIVLALALAVVAVGLATIGIILRHPKAARAAGPATGVFLAIGWILSDLIMQWVTLTYGLAIAAQAAGHAVGAKNPITKYTITFALIVFVIVLIKTRHYGWKTAIVSAIAGAGAGPVMFEFPFDWIIMFHLHVPTPVNLYRWLYFIPLFLFIAMTLALLTLSPAARLRRETLFALAGMFVIWVVWAATGFNYPDAPLPIVLNVTSKLMAAAAGLFIFVPLGSPMPTPEPAVATPTTSPATSGGTAASISPTPAATSQPSQPVPDTPYVPVTVATRTGRDAAPGQPLLSIEHLTKKYGELVAVDDLTMTIDAGDIFGFIGLNGAGKTTTIKAVVGIHDFDSGDILVNGTSVKTDPTACKKQLAYIPDNPDLYEFMSGIEYLNFVADVFNVSSDDRRSRIDKYATSLELKDDLRSPISSYSHGMKQKLAVISALIHNPRLLVLDEPFVGLDPKATFQLKEYFREMTAAGAAIFFSTHGLEVAQNLCNKIAIIEKGVLLEAGPIEEIVGKKSLETVFLGLLDEGEGGLTHQEAAR